ncbi:MAG: efflux RND transporter periplasmic adaptor subunit [Thiothrix sp.]|uniref:efflux RND transporter periplasmic adaptor subunit n=1 Tax=Thiothrix sp. TaxID=1032 RepID=UPI0026184FDD|nr:efflux RND transporter periplasmic adaptor subunit [Thiothrix sp.]MDD5393532.1 efflux RND transporter periplasmic adaptor subunit [Thiothrix sp.]
MTVCIRWDKDKGIMQDIAKFKFMIPALLLGTALLSACGKSNDAGKPPQKEAEVGVITLKPETVTLTSELPGRVTPLQVAEVRPQVTGIIQERLFQEGSQVKKGTPLYQIDSATYQAAADTAAAQLAKAEAALESARSKAQRGQGLADRGLISRDVHDDQLTEQKQAEADVAVAQAALKNARVNLAYTHVKAPIDGFIGKSAVTAGALVTANQANALATIQPLDPILVDITQASTELLRLKREQAAAVNLLLPDGSAYPHAGKLAFTDLTVDAASGSVTVRAEFPNPEQQLLPGMFVRAKLGAGGRKDALLVPQPSVSRKANGAASVWVVKADSTLEQRTIQATQAVGDKWVVESGLTAGEQVVVDGLQKAKPGAKVKPVPVKG